MIEQASEREADEPSATDFVLGDVALSSRIMPVHTQRLGGDWCEAFPVSRDQIGLSIGDVCGHGESKYRAMAAIRRSIRDAALRGSDPAHVLTVANRFLREYDLTELATAIFAFLNIRSQTLVYANAGHPVPLLVGPAGSLYFEARSPDLPLGCEAEAVPRIYTVPLPPGSLLVLYTDGVTEHQRRPLEGVEQLRKAALRAYATATRSAAVSIERSMRLSADNCDDAAILTARTSSYSAQWNST